MKWNEKYKWAEETIQIGDREVLLVLCPKTKDYSQLASYFNTLDLESLVQGGIEFAVEDNKNCDWEEIKAEDLKIATIAVNTKEHIELWFDCPKLGHHSVVVDYIKGKYKYSTIEG